MSRLTVTTRPAAEIAADSLVIGAVSDDGRAVLAPGHGLGKAAQAHLEAALADLDAKGSVDEVIRVVSVPGVKATSVVVTGLGSAPDQISLRAGAAAALRSLASKKAVVVALPAATVEDLTAVSDGAAAGDYTYVKPAPAGAKTSGSQPRESNARPTITLVSQMGTGKGIKEAVSRAQIVASARDFCRDLVNTPPNLLTPQGFVDAVKAAVSASSAKISVSVLDEKALLKGGFGGIVGVGQGSANPPRIVTMSYTPAKAKATIALVGKGITFDSGGLCIKPPAGMATMKCDMAGAAAVAAAVIAAAELGGPVGVTGYLCLAENMPSGTAQRPSDVVTMRNKTTVEILDTDAEGRMVLADGIALAAEAKPDAIIDIATLTGAQMIALGNDLCGVMGNIDAFRSRVVDAATSVGEGAWPMPLPKGLRSGLDSATADIAHKADRFGGMLTAGIFLGTFVPEGLPWAHIDIAGPAFNEHGAKGLKPKGGTGFGVATLVALTESYA